MTLAIGSKNVNGVSCHLQVKYGIIGIICLNGTRKKLIKSVLKLNNMGNPKGNPGNKGNKNATGRPSVKETIWHKEKWEMDSKVRELEAKIATGVYSVRDVYLLKALKADPVILKNLADKVLANLLDISNSDESFKPNPEMRELASELKNIIKAKYGIDK